MGVTKYRDPVTGQWIAESKYEIETIPKMHIGAEAPTDSSVQVWIKEVDLADEMFIPTASEIETLIDEKVAEAVGDVGGGGATVDGAVQGNLLTVDASGNITDAGINASGLANGSYVVGKANTANTATTATNATKLNGQDASYYATEQDFVNLAMDLSNATGSWTENNFPDTDTLNTYKIIYLDPNGSDDNDGLTQEEPMLTINEALKRYKGAYNLELSLAHGTYPLDAYYEINGFNYIHFRGRSSTTSDVIINCTGGELIFTGGTVYMNCLTLNLEGAMVLRSCDANIMTVAFVPSNNDISGLVDVMYGHAAIGQCTFGSCDYAIGSIGSFVGSFNNAAISGATIGSAHYTNQGGLVIENWSGSADLINENGVGSVISTSSTPTTTAQVRTTTLATSTPDSINDGAIVAVYE